MYTKKVNYQSKKNLGYILLFFFISALFAAKVLAQPAPAPSTIDPHPGPITQSSGTPNNPSFDLNIHLDNPLKAQTIQDAIKLFMGIILKLAIPVIILFFLWTGFTYITALGNPTQIGKAHRMFLYTIIGTLLVLGAWVITNAIVGTINAVINP